MEKVQFETKAYSYSIPQRLPASGGSAYALNFKPWLPALLAVAAVIAYGPGHGSALHGLHSGAGLGVEGGGYMRLG